MERRDPLRVLEAAWSFEASEQAWLKGVIDAAQPYDLGRGSAAYVASVGRSPGFRSFTTTAPEITLDLIEAGLRAIPARLWRRVHAPMPTTSNLLMLRNAARDVQAPDPKQIRRAMPRTFAVVGGDARAETVVFTTVCGSSERLSAVHRALLDALGAHVGSALRLRR